MKLTKDDITTWNGCRWNSEKHDFSIEKLNESILNENEMGYLETFFEDKGVKVDLFNMEYLGCLMGVIYSDKQTLVNTINEYFKIKK